MMVVKKRQMDEENTITSPSRISCRSDRKRVGPVGPYRSLSEGLSVDTRRLVTMHWDGDFSCTVERNDGETEEEMKGAHWQVSFMDEASSPSSSFQQHEERQRKDSFPQALPNTPPVQGHRGITKEKDRKKERALGTHRTRPFTPMGRARVLLSSKGDTKDTNGNNSSSCVRKRRRPCVTASTTRTEQAGRRKPRRTASAPSGFLMSRFIPPSFSTPRGEVQTRGPSRVPLSPAQLDREEEEEREEGNYSLPQHSPRPRSHSAFVATGPYSTLCSGTWSTVTNNTTSCMDLGMGVGVETQREGREEERERKTRGILTFDNLRGGYEGGNEEEVTEDDDEEEEDTSVSFDEAYQGDEGMTFDLEL